MQNRVQYTIQDQSWYSTEAAWDGLFLQDSDSKTYTKGSEKKTMQNIWSQLAGENFGNNLGIADKPLNHQGSPGVGTNNNSDKDYNINIYTKIFKILEVMTSECNGQEVDKKVKSSQSYKLFLDHFGYKDQDISKLTSWQKKSLMKRIMNFIPRVERQLAVKVSQPQNSQDSNLYDFSEGGNYYKSISHYSFPQYINDIKNNRTNSSISYLNNSINQNPKSSYEAIYGGYKQIMNFKDDDKIIDNDQPWYIQQGKQLIQDGKISQNGWNELKKNMEENGIKFSNLKYPGAWIHHVKQNGYNNVQNSVHGDIVWALDDKKNIQNIYQNSQGANTPTVRLLMENNATSLNNNPFYELDTKDKWANEASNHINNTIGVNGEILANPELIYRLDKQIEIEKWIQGISQDQSIVNSSDLVQNFRPINQDHKWFWMDVIDILRDAKTNIDLQDYINQNIQYLEDFDNDITINLIKNINTGFRNKNNDVNILIDGVSTRLKDKISINIDTNTIEIEDNGDGKNNKINGGINTNPLWVGDFTQTEKYRINKLIVDLNAVKIETQMKGNEYRIQTDQEMNEVLIQSNLSDKDFSDNGSNPDSNNSFEMPAFAGANKNVGLNFNGNNSKKNRPSSAPAKIGNGNNINKKEVGEIISKTNNNNKDLPEKKNEEIQTEKIDNQSYLNNSKDNSMNFVPERNEFGAQKNMNQKKWSQGTQKIEPKKSSIVVNAKDDKEKIISKLKEGWSELKSKNGKQLQKLKLKLESKVFEQSINFNKVNTSNVAINTDRNNTDSRIFDIKIEPNQNKLANKENSILNQNRPNSAPINDNRKNNITELTQKKDSITGNNKNTQEYQIQREENNESSNSQNNTKKGNNTGFGGKSDNKNNQTIENEDNKQSVINTLERDNKKNKTPSTKEKTNIGIGTNKDVSKKENGNNTISELNTSKIDEKEKTTKKRSIGMQLFNRILFITIGGKDGDIQDIIQGKKREEIEKINNFMHKYRVIFGNNKDLNKKVIQYIKESTRDTYFDQFIKDNKRNTDFDKFAKENKGNVSPSNGYGSMLGNFNNGERRHYQGHNSSQLYGGGAIPYGSNMRGNSVYQNPTNVARNNSFNQPAGRSANNGGGGIRTGYGANNSNNMSGILGGGRGNKR